MSDLSERFGDLLEAEIENVKLETDTNGFTRVRLGDEELDEVNKYLTSELTTAYEDWRPKWANAVENLETYKAIKLQIQDSGPAIYPAPLARIPADQVIASTYNTIMRPRPVFAIDAYLNAKYPVPQQAAPPPPPQPGQEPPPAPPMEATEVSSEDIAKRFRQGYEFIVRERMQFGKKALRAIGHAVKGCPYWWKTSARPNESTKLVPKIDGALVDLDDKYESTRMRGDIIQHELVPYFNGMMPIDQDEVCDSPWFAERGCGGKMLLPDELLKKWAADEFFLIGGKEDAERLAADVVDLFDPNRARAASTTEKKSPEKPTQVCDVWLVWFYWTVRYKSKDDGKTHVKRMNLLGDFHRTAGKLMNCFVNQYEHQERPYELMDQFDDGGSTVENMRYHQTVFTHCTQAEIKNIFIANNHIIWHDPYNETLTAYFKSHPIWQPGDVVPGVYGKDWGVQAMGEQHASMLEFMKFVLTMSQLDSKQSRYSSGDIPGRTPAYTMKQALEQAGEEPHLFLHRLSGKLSRMLRLDMETRRQFQPLGEVLPMWDPKSKSTVEIPFQFPVGDVLDNFRIALTASDEALAAEVDPQAIMANKQAVMTDGEYVAKIITGIINIQQPIPQSAVALFAKVANRDQKLLMQLLDVSTTDEESFDLTPEIAALIEERNQQLALQQKMQMELQHAQMNGGGQQPTKPEPARISFSLTGQMTPDMVMQVAKMAGIEVQSAIAPSQPGGTVPQGQPGIPGGSAQPGGQPSLPPNPVGAAPQAGGNGTEGVVQ